MWVDGNLALIWRIRHAWIWVFREWNIFKIVTRALILTLEVFISARGTVVCIETHVMTFFWCMVERGEHQGIAFQINFCGNEVYL